MSNSSDFRQLKEDQKEISFDNFSSPISNSSDGSLDIVSNPNLLHLEQDSNSPKKEEEEESDDDNQSTATHFGKSEVADDDDGFRTPTSLDQRIPVMTKCPPAPRKPRAVPTTTAAAAAPPPPPPCSRKRKFSPKFARSNIQLDFSCDVESMFPPRIYENIGRKMNKSSKGDDAIRKEDDAK